MKTYTIKKRGLHTLTLEQLYKYLQEDDVVEVWKDGQKIEENLTGSRLIWYLAWDKYQGVK